MSFTTRTKRRRRNNYTFNLHKFKDDLHRHHEYIVIYKDKYLGKLYLHPCKKFATEEEDGRIKKFNYITDVAHHFDFANAEMLYRSLYIEDAVISKTRIQCSLISSPIRTDSSFWDIRSYICDNNNKVVEQKYRDVIRKFKQCLLERLNKYHEVSVQRVEMRLEREEQLRQNREIETKEEEYENTSLFEVIEIKLSFLKSQERRGLINNEDYEKFKNILLKKMIDL